MPKLMYKNRVVSGSPVVIDDVIQNNKDAVTSGAVYGALTNYWKIPQYTNKTTLADKLSSFVAPSDGVIVTTLTKTGSTTPYYTSFYVNNCIIADNISGNSNQVTSLVVPIPKGARCEWVYENSTYCSSRRNFFIPFE